MTDESNARDRVQERIGSLERIVERLDERMLGKLGKDDATTLMDFASTGDSKLREDFLGRLGDLRSAVRDGFQHNERETAAAIYKATNESEGRVTNQINKLESMLTKLEAAVATLGAAAIANSSQPPERRGMHPAVPWTGGLSGGAMLMYLVLAFMGMVPRPGG